MPMRVLVIKNLLPVLMERLPNATTLLTRRISEHLLQVARTEVPVKTGFLRDHHRIFTAETAGVQHDAGIEVYDVPYAMFVHYGTLRIAPNPWLQRTADQIGSFVDEQMLLMLGHVLAESGLGEVTESNVEPSG